MPPHRGGEPRSAPPQTPPLAAYHRWAMGVAEVIANILTRARRAWLLRGGYEPARYWRRRGRGYRPEFDAHSEHTRRAFVCQEAQFLEALRPLEFDSVLEVGCGFGRMLRLVADEFAPGRIAGVDVSRHQLRRARDLLKGRNPKLYEADVTRGLPFLEDGTFDLAFTSEVLMHLTEPEPIIREMARVSRRYVAHLEYTAAQPEPERWEFRHDLPGLYRRIFGIEVAEKEIGKQRFFLADIRARTD